MLKGFINAKALYNLNVLELSYHCDCYLDDSE